DKKSPFGWGPTPLLMELIVERTTAEKAKPLYDADIMYQLLCDAVFGYEAERGLGSVFTWEILHATGLLLGDGFDDEWVTERLHNLFFNGYLDKRRQDGLAILPEVPGLMSRAEAAE
ncbi:MAG TPA: hypothetical protein VK832_16955, partial [Burkholderiaceae bacterium]|nr:hypothetical protein [Burkholderiaceae bacterium]